MEISNYENYKISIIYNYYLSHVGVKFDLSQIANKSAFVYTSYGIPDNYELKSGTYKVLEDEESYRVSEFDFKAVSKSGSEVEVKNGYVFLKLF